MVPTRIVQHVPAPQEGEIHHPIARRIDEADEQAAVPPGLEEGVRVGAVHGQERRQQGLVREPRVDVRRQLVRLCRHRFEGEGAGGVTCLWCVVG